jgi:hypothetical protein
VLVAVRARIRGSESQLTLFEALVHDLAALPGWIVRFSREQGPRRGVAERADLAVELQARGLDEALLAVRTELDRLHHVAGREHEMPVIEWRRPRRVVEPG